ncbi:hypothetical protein N7481_001892 [Penicillium waksmanii]|uniref:uncharacterized protein n=1 Tax=Penicillium waksmanii TaxID=69791 RepID=UPI002548B046|nr:uncharacterized protein N7481_001892 [Penicillium waksmanii]KAJ5994915.1 hypothetical protein N7481_001892 [Penicillium waksmanii]
MAKRKRTLTDDASEALPESSSQPHPSEGKDASVLDVLPGITRKITACGACRKQKIKCDMTNGPPCTRCRRRGLSCVLNKSLQSLVEEVKNTEQLQNDIQGIHEVVDNICQHLSLPRPRPLLTAEESAQEEIKVSQDDELDGDHEDLDGCEISPPDTPSALQAPIDTFLDIAKLGSPGSSDNTPGSTTRQKQNPMNQDLIGKGIITTEAAEELVDRYFTRLDPYLYGICSGYHSLQQIRSTSPVLFAAICTVSSLQDPNGQKTYEACNREFRRLVSRSIFEKHNLEYVRALCISSFWLSDASRILASDAIRRAADMRLHRGFDHLAKPIDPRLLSTENVPTSAPEIDALKDRVRLWYLIFITDQHLSILHNRDPLLRSDKEIALGWETFLAREDTTDSDVRIISQVALLVIMSQVRDLLGSDQESRVPQSLSNQIIHYSRQLDRWFTKFSALFKPDPYIGDFPKCGLQLHYHFGKLYLGHQVFKGLNGEVIPSHFVTAAGMAHGAAVAIFEMILHEHNLQHSLVGMPHYFHIMIAFAGHFLLEVTRNYHVQLSISPDQDFELIRRVLELFEATPSIQQHPICRMTPGLTRKLRECVGMLQRDGQQTISTLAVGAGAIDYQAQNDHAQMDPPAGPFSFGEDTLTADDFLFADFGEFTFPGMMSNGTG